MTEVKKIGVFSLAKIVGVLYFVMGLLFWVLFGCFMIIGLLAEPLNRQEDAAILIGMFCFLPFIYGVMGFIGGGLIGLVYNALAARIGGIELELSGGYNKQLDLTTTSESAIDDPQQFEG